MNNQDLISELKNSSNLLGSFLKQNFFNKINQTIESEFGILYNRFNNLLNECNLQLNLNEQDTINLLNETNPFNKMNEAEIDMVQTFFEDCVISYYSRTKTLSLVVN